MKIRGNRVSLDPREPAFVQNPYPFYAAMRACGPVFYWEELGHWCCARHAEVSTLLRDRRLGRQILHVASREELGWPKPPDHLGPFFAFEEHSLLELEPPVHTRLRGMIQPAFLPRHISRLRPMIEDLTHRLIDGFEAGGSTDLIAALATPIPVVVIAEFLGVPPDMAPQILAWSHNMVAMYQARRDRQIEDAAVAATIAFSDYMRDLLREERTRRGQNFLADLIAARDDEGNALSEDELVTTAILLLNAGHEATVHAIGHGVKAVLENRGRAAILRDPAAGVEEMLRFDAPLHMFKRYALDDFDLSGTRLRRGEQVGLLLGAANHDAEKFAAPETFLPDRQPNPHVSFGAGIHFCIGAPLARLELQTALPILFARLPALRLDGASRYLDTWHFRALEELPVVW